MTDRLAAWWFAVGAIVVYAVAVVVPLPAPVFLPRLGLWDLIGMPGEPGMRWYGWLIAGLFGGAAGMAVGRVMRRAPSWHLVWILATVALALVTVVHERSWFLR